MVEDSSKESGITLKEEKKEDSVSSLETIKQDETTFLQSEEKSENTSVDDLPDWLRDLAPKEKSEESSIIPAEKPLDIKEEESTVEGA